MASYWLHDFPNILIGSNRAVMKYRRLCTLANTEGVLIHNNFTINLMKNCKRSSMLSELSYDCDLS